MLKASGETKLPSELGGDMLCIPTEQDHDEIHTSKPVSQALETIFSPVTSKSTLAAGGSQSNLLPASSPNNIPSTWHCYAPSACLCRPAFKGVPPPAPSDDELLNVYRTEMFPVYPFVAIPSATTASELASKRPFLMQAIRTVACYRSPSNMHYNSYKTMQHISEHMLMRASRSLDILLGIIIYLGWYHKHCFVHAQLHNLIHLAMALVSDLGLNRNPQLPERMRFLGNNTPPEVRARTLEERRAMLGVWYVASVLHVGFSRVESLAYSKYVQSCLQELEGAREYESDALLVALVRIQRVTAEIHLLQTDDTNDLNPPPSAVPRASKAAYVAAFQAELDKLKASMPRSVRGSMVIDMSLASAQLHLYELPILTPALLRALSAPVSAGEQGAMSNLDVLYHANTALKRWFDVFMSFPVSLLLTLPVGPSVCLIHATTMLSRLAKLMAPWIDSRLEKGVGTPSETTVCKGSSSSDAAATPATVEAPPKTSPLLPQIPPPIAALKEHLAVNPNLALDIPGLLEAMANRFEAAAMDLERQEDELLQPQPLPRQSPPPHNASNNGKNEDNDGKTADSYSVTATPITNIWQLAVRKIRMARANLEALSGVAYQAGGDDLAGREGRRRDASAPVGSVSAVAEQKGPNEQRAQEGMQVLAGKDGERGEVGGGVFHPCTATTATATTTTMTTTGTRAEVEQGAPAQASAASTSHLHGFANNSGETGAGAGDFTLATAATVLQSQRPFPPAAPLSVSPHIPGLGFCAAAAPFPGVMTTMEGAEWLRNSFWATSSDIFDAVDTNLWWDSGTMMEHSHWGLSGVAAGSMETDGEVEHGGAI